MAATRPTPKTLYKYRAFSARTVDLLCADKVYFADPNTFNDPLDSKPNIHPDLDVAALEITLGHLIRGRIAAEMTAAARSIKYRGPRTVEHIARLSDAEATRVIEEISYAATNPEYTQPPPGPQLALLAHEIERELLRQYDKRVFSLAKRYDCPLMWSHYGEQHHGLCLGYSIPDDARANLHPISYGGTRLVPASRVSAMAMGDARARAEVDALVLLRKASSWRYEREWRLFGPAGVADSPLELKEVLFGTRCTDSVKHAVARAMDERQTRVRLYEMREVRGTFKLKRFPLDVDELARYYPRRARALLEAFDEVEVPTEANS